MKVLLDTNVIVDAMILTRPGYNTASLIWLAAKQGLVECFITASSITDLYYISRNLIRSQSQEGIDERKIVRLCLNELSILSVGRSELEEAFKLEGKDFEDDLQIACAAGRSLDAIVTNDVSGGFDKSSVPILSPSQLVERLQALGETSLR